jgi:predicted MFS family arabinose efflux permease
VTTVALPLVALETLHASTFEVGVISAAGLLAWLLLGLSAGVVVEGTASRPLLVICDLVRAVAVTSVPITAVLGLLTITQIVVTALVVGTGSVFFDIASQKYLPAVVESNELMVGNARLQAGYAVATTAGPPTGGALVQAVSAPFALMVDAASYLCSALLISTVTKRENPVERAQPARMLPQIREGLAYAMSDQIVRLLAITAASLNLLGAAFDTLMIPFLLRNIGLPAGMIGAVLAVGGIGGFLGAAACATFSRRIGVVRTLLAAALLEPLSSLLVPIASPGWELGLLAFGLLAREACIAVFSLIARSHRQDTVPRGLLARVTASIRFISWGVLPIGAFAGGVLGELIGNRGALLVVCGLLWLSPLLLWSLWTRRGRRRFDGLEHQHWTEIGAGAKNVRTGRNGSNWGSQPASGGGGTVASDGSRSQSPGT